MLRWRRRRHSLSIWALGLGYFIFYTPYSGLTKAATGRLLPGLREQAVSGSQLLPLSVLATVVGIYAFITAMGWWRHAHRARLLGVEWPVPSLAGVASGVCMATIIATTTLAFAFSGTSILFVLVLLRGGVLMIGPVVDTMRRRRVRWFSWAAMAVSLLSLVVVLADVQNYVIGIAAVLDVIAYLAAYFIRLNVMSALAKTEDPDVTLRYFVEEQMVASPALLLFLVGVGCVGHGPLADSFHWGLASIWRSAALWPAILIGVFYAALMVCTTLIFLDRRENTFCIPMHCGSSMMSGVVASAALAYLYQLKPPSGAQYLSTFLIVVALGFLSPLHHVKDWVEDAIALRRLRLLIYCADMAKGALDTASFGIARFALAEHPPRPRRTAARDAALRHLGRLQRILLFVCSGNTCRSVMAAAISNAEIAKRLKLSFDAFEKWPWRALSAGLSASPGAPMIPAAASALQRLAVPVPVHAARPLTSELVDLAAVVFCMTRSHRDTVIERNPAAAWKVRCLDGEVDIGDPGTANEPVERCAQDIETAVHARLDEMALMGEA